MEFQNQQLPLVSVIVPIYRIDRYIGLCIESILNQTYQNLEIILVDDGSPDRCPEICDLYAAKDNRIKVIHKKNGGLVSARKAGLLEATGELVGYVDGDDWIGPGFYESLVATMMTSQADLVAAGFSRDLFSKSEHFLNTVPCGLYEGARLCDLQSCMLSCGAFYRLGVTTYVWNKLFRREILMEHQMAVDERITIGEDAAVVYPVLLSCKRVYIADNCSYHYRQREDSMLKKSSAFRQEAVRLKILYQYLSSCVSKYPMCANLQSQIDDYVLGICIMRSGGILQTENGDTSLRIFEQNIIGKKIVVYSAGTFGQQLVTRYRENQRCSIVGWVDDDYWEYRRCCLNVDPVEAVASLDYDYIVIASVNPVLSEKIERSLLDCGVPTHKMLKICCPREGRAELLHSYLTLDAAEV